MSSAKRGENEPSDLVKQGSMRGGLRCPMVDAAGSKGPTAGQGQASQPRVGTSGKGCVRMARKY